MTALESKGTSTSHGDAPRITTAIAKRIRLVGLDVDGVLTDGGVYLGDVDGARMEFKRFDILDGLGIKMLQLAGIDVAIITGRVSDAVALRARELAITDVVQDIHARKLPALRKLLAAKGIDEQDVAFVGDDLPDIAVLRVVGLPVVVGNCTEDVAHLGVRLTRNGGHGAVREFAELLLRARGEWDGLVEAYVKSRSEDAV
ncbi:MAG TPA: HAD hydrolase family protein [Gemmatimonadaceae bacterium]|nr:HAD hydrolase family protein [Gemmatimonadaceae bacterium]